MLFINGRTRLVIVQNYVYLCMCYIQIRTKHLKTNIFIILKERIKLANFSMKNNLF